MTLIQPAILARTIHDFRAKWGIAKRLTHDMVHIDIMDGLFVRNTTVQPQALKGIRGLRASYHVMAFRPERYIERLRNAGAREIVIHVEAGSTRTALKRIKSAGMRAGIALNPRTHVERLKPFLGLIDTVLVMSVQPGFSGQRFRPSVLKKVRAIRRMMPRVRIGIDGGITAMTAVQVARAGADFVCAASALLGADKPRKAYAALKKSLR